MTRWLIAAATAGFITVAAASIYAASNAPDGSWVPGSGSRGIILPRDAELAATNGNALLVDVREPDEIQHGAPLGANASFPFRLDGSRDEDFVAEMVGVVRGKLDTKIIRLCATGVRSAAARDLLLDHGFENVKSLVGGFVAWQRDGLPIVAGRSQAGR